MMEFVYAFGFYGKISDNKEGDVIQFEVLPTEAASSYPNGSVTIATSNMDLLFGDTLGVKFCQTTEIFGS